ncbi:MAG: glycosyltransferase family 4 protein [Pseudomonadota bacterium]
MKFPNRVLVVHNAYQHRGGEDTVVEAEVALLRARGHEVEIWSRSNEEVVGMPALKLAGQTLWSSHTFSELTSLVRKFQPDVIHAHNTFPLISPSLYWAASKADVPVVQTLHNFRLMCLNALFLRNGQVCEDCMGHVPWKGVARGCYRNSRPASAVLAGMLTLHRGLGTFQNKVARFIALNEFCRDKFIQGGLPPDLVTIKPNFVDSPPPMEVNRQGLLFVGRLSTEKGINTLSSAMSMQRDINISVAGDGPEASLIRDAPGVTMLGALPSDMVRSVMEESIALIVPSIWYENFPRTIVEAFAAGLPVIASRIGALADIVSDKNTGLFFEPGNAQDLADKMAWAQAHPAEMHEMGRNARAHYERSFTPEVNYQQLINIYQAAIAEQQS